MAPNNSKKRTHSVSTQDGASAHNGTNVDLNDPAVADAYADESIKHPSTKRAKEVDASTPLDNLQEILSQQPEGPEVKTVLHWFRSKDLREQDNRALYAAATKAKEANTNLIAMYLFSPADMDWHGTSAARSDFILQSLRLLKQSLEAKNIPLAMVTAKERGEKTEDVLRFVRENGVSHVFANYEYEVDELRRDISVARHLAKEAKGEVKFELRHDQTVMEPGALKTGSGGPMKVFTPYHKAWLAEVGENPSLLDELPEPEGNDAKAKEQFKHLFESQVPGLPESKKFGSDEDRDRIRGMWPAGTEAGMKRLRDFLQNKV